MLQLFGADTIFEAQLFGLQLYLGIGLMLESMRTKMSEELLLIGKAAAQAGVNIQTPRYYERRGLLVKPERTPAGQRSYKPESVQRVRFIKRARQLGFSLNEIEDLLRLRSDMTARPAPKYWPRLKQRLTMLTAN